VVGFDDVPEAKFYLPALTTVRQDFGQIGRVAVESLIRQIETGAPEHIAPLDAQLIVRGSTAAPRA
jgi:DNA-binding LacI/PurR family transcriptional regulator